MKVFEFTRQPYPTALMVVGFPSHGLVGGIAASFLIRDLDMSLVGTLNDDLFPPSVSVVDGVGVSPVQIWAASERCGLDGECDQLLVVKSDLSPPPELLLPIAEALLAWAKEKEVRLVVTLEGVNQDVGEEEFVNVVGLVSPGARHLIGRREFEIMGQGIVTGPSAAFMVKSLETGVPVLGLFTNASARMPDAAAAAKLLGALNPLVPHTHIDPGPLQEQAQAIEAALKASMKSQKQSLERLADSQTFMYA